MNTPSRFHTGRTVLCPAVTVTAARPGESNLSNAHVTGKFTGKLRPRPAAHGDDVATQAAGTSRPGPGRRRSRSASDAY
jgi:hypothetical protein